MIEGVKQQKWWGWGEEGKGYRYEDKPKFPAFVKKMVGVDITAPVPPVRPFSTLDVPATQLTDALRGLGLPVETGIFGADMRVALVNDGPVTIWIDTADRP